MTWTLTGTNGPTTFPVGGGTAAFDIEGTGLEFSGKTPAIVSIGTQDAYKKAGVGVDYNSSSATKLHVVHVPPSLTGSGQVDIWVCNDPSGNPVGWEWKRLQKALTYEETPATWQALGPDNGVPGAIIHVNGKDFNPEATYEITFNGVDAPNVPGPSKPPQPKISTTGLWVKVPAALPAWNRKATVEVTIDGNPVQFTGTAGASVFTYTDTCAEDPPQPATPPIAVGKGFVQTARVAPSGAIDPPPPVNIDKVDVVNPTVVNAGKYAATASLEGPPRAKSWASGMLWADNATTWYNHYGPVEAVARQTPVYADPLVVCYTNDDGHNYFQQVAKQPPTKDNAESVYGKGFHLSMPNPAMDGASPYNSGTGLQSYNQACEIGNGSQSGIQEGLSQLAVWRDTLVVYPSGAALSPGDEPAYLPPTADVDRQGDWDVDFVMAGAGAGQYLKLTIAQGSPFAQFTAKGTDGVTIAGVFPHDDDNPPGVTAAPIVTTGLAGGSGTLHHVILHQQVNQMYRAASSPKGHTNWVSFAVIWDPDVATWTTQTVDGQVYGHLAFARPATDSHFVVAGLPSQMKNSPPQADYDAAKARAWAQAVAPFAMNFYTGSSIRYHVGHDAAGKATAPNEVNVTHTPALAAVGPVGTAGETVFLLQPIHYSTAFDDGRDGVAPLNGAPTVVRPTGAKSDDYWISRGRLEAISAASFDVTWLAPAMLPFYPAFPAGASRQGENGGEHGTDGTTFELRDMASAMIAINHYLSEVGGANSPATTSMDGPVPQDTYNVAKAFVRAAKMLHMLLPIVDDPAPPADVYHVGSPAHGADYTPLAALELFTANLAKAFRYYFGEAPTCSNGNTASFYYSYYDPASHHLLLYPASAGAAAWPTNLANASGVIPELWDGYGTVTMLNDHHYTYGYHILAAALLAMALQDPKMPASVTGQPDLANWWAEDAWGAVVDQLIMDIAYDPDQVESWYAVDGLTYPKLEWMDQWTGISWTDGFMANALDGHNANSPWEHLQAWAGIAMWGQVTGRQDLTDLGTYLLTLGVYAQDAYRYNTIKTYVPSPATGDSGADDTFLVKATANLPGQGNTTQGNLPYVVEQQSLGQTMWHRQMSDATPGKESVRVTYIFQGGIRSDNTYNQTPLGQQYTSTYPHAPWSVAMVRAAAYMKHWAAAIGFQNGQSYFPEAYSTNTNLLYAALGLSQTVSWLQGDVENPLPVEVNGKPSTDYEHAAFRFAVVGDGKPYDWYWKMSAWTAYEGKPLWQQWDPDLDPDAPLDKISLYVSADKTIAEPLLDLYTYDAYGVPQPTMFAENTATKLLHPLALAFDNGGVKSFMAYNPSGDAITLQFKDAAGAAVGEPATVAAHELHVWTP